MRAFVLDGYGAIADHVRLAEIADPVAGPDDVLIEIHAASLNPIDFKIVRGDLKRVSKYRLPRPFGFDASGVVLSAGARATGIQAGRCGLCARVARHHRHVCRTDRAAGEFRGAQAGGRLPCGSRGAAAGGVDHASGIWPRPAPPPASAS